MQKGMFAIEVVALIACYYFLLCILAVVSWFYLNMVDEKLKSSHAWQRGIWLIATLFTPCVVMIEGAIFWLFESERTKWAEPLRSVIKTPIYLTIGLAIVILTNMVLWHPLERFMALTESKYHSKAHDKFERYASLHMAFH